MLIERDDRMGVCVCVCMGVRVGGLMRECVLIDISTECVLPALLPYPNGVIGLLLFADVTLGVIMEGLLMMCPTCFAAISKRCDRFTVVR